MRVVVTDAAGSHWIALSDGCSLGHSVVGIGNLLTGGLANMRTCRARVRVVKHDANTIVEAVDRLH
jgi:hypothetical protein